jgi:hypothetical protein
MHSLSRLRLRDLEVCYAVSTARFLFATLGLGLLSVSHFVGPFRSQFFAPLRAHFLLIDVMGLLKEKKETVISFDGKTLRGTLDEQRGKRILAASDPIFREKMLKNLF